MRRHRGYHRRRLGISAEWLASGSKGLSWMRSSHLESCQCHHAEVRGLRLRCRRWALPSRRKASKLVLNWVLSLARQEQETVAHKLARFYLQ